MNKEHARSLSPAAVKVLLTAVFILTITAIILQFTADLQFNSAKKLESLYLWQEAMVISS